MNFNRREFIKGILGAGMCAGLLSGDALKNPLAAQLFTDNN